MSTYGLDGPLGADESIEHAWRIICAAHARPILEARSDGFLAVLAKNTVRGRTGRQHSQVASVKD